MTDITNPALTRAKEHEKIPEAETALRQTIVHFRKFTEEHAAGSDKYSHIDAADVAKVVGWVKEHEAFVDDRMGSQRQLRKCDPLVITAAILEERKVTLERNCNPIVNKPKPVAPPPAAAPAATPADAPKPEAASTATPTAEAKPAPPSSGDLD